MVLFRRLESGAFKNYYPARVVKLVDTGDLKSLYIERNIL